MKSLIKLLRAPLNIIGFDVLSGSPSVWHTIRQKYFYLSILTLCSCFSYSIYFNRGIVASDKIFLFNADISFIWIMTQGLLFWRQTDKIVLIFRNIEKLHATREEKWLRVEAELVYQKCFEFMRKLVKYVIPYRSSINKNFDRQKVSLTDMD